MPEWATRLNWLRWSPLVIAVVLMAGTLGPYAGSWLGAFAQAEFHVHAPRWELWEQLKPRVQFHVAAAVAALLIGVIVIARPKGRGLHKALGWAWVIAMALTAISSLFMTGLNGDSYSLIHLLSGWTLVALPLGIFAIRNRNVAGHRRAMTGMFFGGLLIAGALTFIPGRFMFEVFFG